MLDNKISSYLSDNGIKVYETVGSSYRVQLKKQEDFIELLDKYKPEEVFFFCRVDDTDDKLNDISEEQIQEQLEYEYKFLYPMTDDEQYFLQLDAIIKKHIDEEIAKLTSDIANCTIEYWFFTNMGGYGIEIKEDGKKKRTFTIWEAQSMIVKSCKADVMGLGITFAERAKSELENLFEYLDSDAEFCNLKTKDKRASYFDEIIDNENKDYFALKTLKNNPGCFKKLPDFYMSFDKKGRSRYAEEIFERHNNS